MQRRAHKTKSHKIASPHKRMKTTENRKFAQKSVQTDEIFALPSPPSTPDRISHGHVLVSGKFYAIKTLSILYPHVSFEQLVTGGVYDSVRKWTLEDVVGFCGQLIHSSRCEPSCMVVSMKLVARFKSMDHVRGRLYPERSRLKDPMALVLASCMLADKFLADHALGLGSWMMVYKACLKAAGRSSDRVTRTFPLEWSG